MQEPIVATDLASLAGTWSDTDAAEFETGTAWFNLIDEELWQ